MNEPHYVTPKRSFIRYKLIATIQSLNFKPINSPGPRDQMKGKSRPDPASPASPLHQVGLAGEHCRVVRHVVVRGEDLHLVLARVDYKHHVLNGDASLRNISSKDDLECLSSKWSVVIGIKILQV